MNDIDENQDFIDSRDIISRIEELRVDLNGVVLNEETSEYEIDGVNYSIEYEELESLEALNAEGLRLSADWVHGCTLIRDSYFEEYAMDLAEDIGAIESRDHWPATCINWESACDTIKCDYAELQFNGVTYYVR